MPQGRRPYRQPQLAVSFDSKTELCSYAAVPKVTAVIRGVPLSCVRDGGWRCAMTVFPLCGPRFPELITLHFICRNRRHRRAEVNRLSDKCLEDGGAKQLRPNLDALKSSWMA